MSAYLGWSRAGKQRNHMAIFLENSLCKLKLQNTIEDSYCKGVQHIKGETRKITCYKI